MTTNNKKDQKKVKNEEGVNIGMFGRRTWDKEVFARKAAERANRETSFDTDSKRKTPATESASTEKKPLQARFDDSVDLEANVGKRAAVTADTPLRSAVRKINPTTKVDASGGFYCEICSIVAKDSNSYLDHLNSNAHTSKLGMTRRAEKSSVSSVLKKLAQAPKKKATNTAAKKEREKAEVEERILAQQAEKMQKKRKLEEAKRRILEGGGSDDDEEEKK